MVKTSQFLVDVLWFSLIFTQIHWTKLGGAFLPASGCIVVISPLNPTNVLSLPWLCPWNLMNTTPTAPTTPHWSPSHVYRWWPQATRICSSSHRWTTWGQKRSNCWNTTRPVGSVLWGWSGDLRGISQMFYIIYGHIRFIYVYVHYTYIIGIPFECVVDMQIQLIVFLLSQYTFNWYLQTNPLDWNFSMEDNVNSIEQSFQWVYSLVHHPMRFFYLLSLFHNFHFYSSLLVQLQRKLDQWNLAWSPCNSAQRKPKLQAPRGTTFLLARLGIGKEAPWSQAGAGRRPRPIRHRWHGLKQVLGVNMGDLLRDLQWFTCS
jgi:hypothetical protein